MHQQIGSNSLDFGFRRNFGHLEAEFTYFEAMPLHFQRFRPTSDPDQFRASSINLMAMLLNFGRDWPVSGDVGNFAQTWREVNGESSFAPRLGQHLGCGLWQAGTERRVVPHGARARSLLAPRPSRPPPHRLPRVCPPPPPRCPAHASATSMCYVTCTFRRLGAHV